MIDEAPRIENTPAPGKWSSLALTVGVHVALAAFLFLGISWQSTPPAPMEVELFAAPTETAKVQPETVATPQPVPEPPKPEPEPPKPEPPVEPPKPEPKVEPPKVVPEPEIAVKEPEKPKKEKPKPEPEPPKKEEPKKEPPKPKPAPKPVTPPKPKPAPKPAQDDYMAQLLAKETAAAQQNTERAAAGRASALETDYIGRVAAKVRGNLVRPPGLQGNPEAIFMVEQLPDGQIMSVRLIRSSGIAALDTNIERAIQKSNPLPPPPSQGLRSLEFRFKPMED